MLKSAGADYHDILHINVFLANMNDFDEMNRAYESKLGDCRPARTAVAVTGLPKPGALVTMNLTAVVSSVKGG
jgi:2-iminobutanoate/2-iminopropanoate deaminase